MYKYFITLIIILSSLSSILAQHTEIQHESTFDNPHLLLTGMHGDIPSFSTSSSIRFTQKDYSEDWDLRATISDIEFVNSSFGVYFNQDPRFLYIEEESTFEISGEDNPILKLDANDTDETSINFSANGASSASILYNAQKGSLQLKPYVAYKSSGGNIMTLLENSTVFGPSIVEIAQGRINVNHDASYFNPTMVLRENNGSDYARLHFVNDGEAKRYEIAANPGNSNDRLHIAYDNNPILTVHGTSGTYGKVGINYSLPSYALQLPNNSLSGVGKALANEWRTYSDARVKSDVESLTSAIPLIKELNPVTYFQHDSETMNEELNIKKRLVADRLDS